MTRKSISILLAVLILGSIIGCGGRPNLASLDARELFDYGMEKYQKRKHLDAIDAFQTVIFNFPGESLVDTAQYYLAMTYYDRQDYVLAKVEFNRLLLNYPGSAYAAEAQLMRAVCFYKGTPRHYGLDQTDLVTAIRQFEDFLIDYPESEAADAARTYLTEARTRLAKKTYESGIVYTRLADYRAARVYFQQVIDEYNGTEYAPLAAYELADTYYRAHEWDEAHERFESFRTIYGDNPRAEDAATRSCEAVFFAGEEAFKANDLARARERFDRYRVVCGNDTDRDAKIDEYIEKMGDQTLVGADTTHAGS